MCESLDRCNQVLPGIPLLLFANRQAEPGPVHRRKVLKNPIGECPGIIRRDKQAGFSVAYHLCEATDIRRDDRQIEVVCDLRYPALRGGCVWKNRGIRRRKVIFHLFIGDVIRPYRHDGFQLQTPDPVPVCLFIVVELPHHQEREIKSSPEERESIEKHIEPFVFPNIAEKQEHVRRSDPQPEPGFPGSNGRTEAVVDRVGNVFVTGSRKQRKQITLHGT